MKKIGLFIDYANLWASYKKLGKMLDFQKLCKYLESEFKGTLVIKNIYFAYPKQGTRGYDVGGIHKFGIFLEKELGFGVVKKPLKLIELRDAKGNIIFDSNGLPSVVEKGNLDIELSMDVMRSYSEYDIVILFSGDSDFKCMSDFLMDEGKDVFIYSTIGNISSELMKETTGYYDLIDLPEYLFISRLKHRKQNKDNKRS